MIETFSNKKEADGIENGLSDSELDVPQDRSSKVLGFRNSIRRLAGLQRIAYSKGEALSLVHRDGEELQNVARGLRDDKTVVMAAVSNNGRALQHASERLKDDETVVLTAVSDWGEALEHASERLKADRDVVRMAVAQNGRALRFASMELWGDPELIELGNQTYRQRKNHRKE